MIVKMLLPQLSAVFSEPRPEKGLTSLTAKLWKEQDSSGLISISLPTWLIQESTSPVTRCLLLVFQVTKTELTLLLIYQKFDSYNPYHNIDYFKFYGSYFLFQNQILSLPFLVCVDWLQKRFQLKILRILFKLEWVRSWILFLII